ncbi:GGDEF domain-containing protein [Roseateles sp. DAIF2]|uniref:GGDEF domain-containing protein n=1 Tax=Roseateles sp. DAIF2 TaxID=2714952 RepID=UPI0018A2F096|nr:GGDEF domain-containing protein [Roseateles sp. DAIF2]QPF73053.1 GGDEF domain-containing protein [Roseateles sp. DAIF2]
MNQPLQVLWVDEFSPPILPAELMSPEWGRFTLERCASLDGAARRLGERGYDALLAALPSERAAGLSAWGALSHAVMESAVLVLTPACPQAAALELLQRGVQDVVQQTQWAQHGLARSLRWAIERHRLDRATRRAHALDLDTGLPHRGQLLEHINHLIALRQREPSPMALLVLRLPGLALLRERLGREMLAGLRRRLAQRLRAGVRASDVVAALDFDAFGVLLASTEQPEDAGAVARKLQLALQKPLAASGQELSLHARSGLALYPTAAQEGATLLRLAIAAAHGEAPSSRSEAND